MSRVFKASNGNYLTRQLFYETSVFVKDNILYTLKNEDHMGYTSLYRLYQESFDKDPTEYLFAIENLDGWEHWELLQEAAWFKPYIDKWRREANIRLSSLALRRVQAVSKSGSRESLAASRYLLERGWMDKDEKKRGRPSKAEIKNHLQKEANQVASLEEEAKRIGLN